MHVNAIICPKPSDVTGLLALKINYVFWLDSYYLQKLIVDDVMWTVVSAFV